MRFLNARSLGVPTIAFLSLFIGIYIALESSQNSSRFPSYGYPIRPLCDLEDEDANYQRNWPPPTLWQLTSIAYQGIDSPPANMAAIDAQMAQLKRQRSKNNEELRTQQIAIQSLAQQAMQIIGQPNSERYLQYERDWLTAQAGLLEKSESATNVNSTEVTAAEQLLNRWRQYASRRKSLNLSDLRLIHGITRSLETKCRSEIAARGCEFFLNIIRSQEVDIDGTKVPIQFEPQQSYAELDVILAGTLRRLNLIGQSMLLEGKTFEGMKFNVDSYRGKVVLVDYWATWCGPCVAEYPQLRELWQKYHAQGFEIVGVSMDADRNSLSAYISEKDVPWIILNDAENGGKHPSTEFYNIQTVPSMFLIGRDGNVIATTVEVPKLEQMLQLALKQR
jgi:peroxiredoxin